MPPSLRRNLLPSFWCDCKNQLCKSSKTSIYEITIESGVLVNFLATKNITQTPETCSRNESLGNVKCPLMTDLIETYSRNFDLGNFSRIGSKLDKTEP